MQFLAISVHEVTRTVIEVIVTQWQFAGKKLPIETLMEELQSLILTEKESVQKENFYNGVTLGNFAPSSFSCQECLNNSEPFVW